MLPPTLGHVGHHLDVRRFCIVLSVELTKDVGQFALGVLDDPPLIFSLHVNDMNDGVTHGPHVVSLVVSLKKISNTKIGTQPFGWIPMLSGPRGGLHHQCQAAYLGL